MFRATRILKNGSITVKLALDISGGYAVHITHNGHKSTADGVYPRRHIAVKVANAILEAA